MRIFVTGATGFIGTALVNELIQAGHSVLGLTRSQKGAEALQAAGAEVQSGDLADLTSLQRGAGETEGVIHLAFNSDFTQFQKASEDDRRAIEAMGQVLIGSKRPLIVTSPSAVVMSTDTKPVDEGSPLASWNPRAGSENAVAALAEKGVVTSVVRLSQIHDTRKQGIVTPAIYTARQKGSSGYIGDGSNRWSAAHVSDTARLYRLAFERAEAGAIYHAVAEEGIPVKTIAEVIGSRLNLPVVSFAPEEAEAQFGWLGLFMGLDLSASSVLTRQKLGWEPFGPGLLEDLEQVDYTQSV